MLTNLSLFRRIKTKEGKIIARSEFLVIFLIVALNFVIAKGQDLRIDNQLRILANDCYTRIAIGTRLPKNNVISTTTGKSLTECESICSINRTRCNAFNYGVDSRGNGTCVIGRINTNSKPEDLTIDPDYDVYERRAKTPTGCQHDRLLKIGYGDKKFVDATVPLANNKRTPFGGGRNVPTTKTFGNLFVNANSTDRQKSSFFRGGWYSPIADDTDTRLYDILNDKKNHRTLGHHTFEISYESPNEDHSDSQFRDDEHADLCTNRAGFLEDVPIFCKIFHSMPSRQNFYSTERTKGTTIGKQPNQQSFDKPIDFSAGYGTKIDSLLEKSKACYRKLLSGKRLLENHVRRSVQCDNFEECHRVCEYESAFVCEGFNYGRMKHVASHGRGNDEERPRGYICQLTSVSGRRMNPRRDFVDDSRYDYYVRDWTCPAGKVHRDSFERDWSSNLPAGRPNDHHKWQRPSFPSSYLSGGSYEEPSLTQNTRYYYPSDGLGQARNRPSDYDYYPRHQPPWSSYLPQRPTYNEIIQHSRLPPGRISTPGNDYNYRYYYESRNEDLGKFPRRRIDEHRNWRQEPPGPNDVIQQPGYVYGSSYYGYGKDSDKRSKNHPVQDNFYRPWEKSMGEPAREKLPDQQDRHYDFVYGPAYGYQSRHESSYDSSRWNPATRPNGMSDSHKDCSTRSLMGFKLSRKIVVASYTVGNLEECEMLCSGRIDCLSFAYRYSLVPAAPTDNCRLGNVPFEKLNFYTDLEPERDYDVYAMTGNPRNCQGESKRPRSGQIGQHSRSSEECFWRVRSGYEMPRGLARKETRVENGLGECQLACISARHFTCRSFVFRYDFEEDRGPNCFLSDCPTMEIILAVDTDKGSFNRRQQTELYERGSYGRGCEAHPFVPIYNSMNFGSKPQLAKQDCYSGYQAGCKLSTYAVASVSRVDTESECRRQCSKMRYNKHSPPCMSFSFRIGDEKHGDNCYLSDVPRRDLRPGLDYTYDDDYVMYAWKELEPHCSSPHGEAYDNPTKNDETINYAPDGDDYRSQFTPTTGGFLPSPDHPGTGLYSYNTLFLGARPFDSDRPDFPRSQSPSIGAWSSHDQTSNDGYLPRPDYPDGLASFNLHYTVNGYPCKRGTKCEINKIAGFWSCEPEGSEYGSWDYCCEPNHHCGFSQGYRYPWCYVGASEEQWRPCSDKYFPYLPSPRPAIDKIPIQNFLSSDNNARIDPPFYRYDENRQNIRDSTVCQQGRHWPIAFLHPVPPPNTTDSVALANNRRESNDYKEKATKDNKNEIKTNTTIKDERMAKRSSETMSSPISIRTYKSHLKRRGLAASVNSTNDRVNDELTKNQNEKLPPIFIATEKNMTNDAFPRTDSSFRADYYVSKNNDTAKIKTKRVKDDFDLFAKTNGNFTIRPDKTRYGRVERVTKANNIVGDAKDKK